MKFTPLSVVGAWIVEIEPAEDERGFFARTWCRREFEQRGLNTNLAQCSTSFNRTKGTLRGMHYQSKPHEESKLVRCTGGTIYDVILDLRRGCSTFKHWLGLELSSSNRKMLYVPEGVAHGFQILEDNTEVFYQISEFYYPQYACGIRWDDPAFAIQWPLPAPILSEADKSFRLHSARD